MFGMAERSCPETRHQDMQQIGDRELYDIVYSICSASEGEQQSI